MQNCRDGEKISSWGGGGDEWEEHRIFRVVKLFMWYCSGKYMQYTFVYTHRMWVNPILNYEPWVKMMSSVGPAVVPFSGGCG